MLTFINEPLTLIHWVVRGSLQYPSHNADQEFNPSLLAL